MGVLTRLTQFFSASKKRKSSPPVDIHKRFELLGKTGQGSMSTVYRARDRKLGRTVCLKILDRKKTMDFERRFIGRNKPSEGAICAALRHKNVVRTFEHGVTTAREDFIVFELIEGVGLNYLIDTRGAQLEGNRVNLLAQIADGLEYVHGQRYIHRDICPRNVMVAHDGAVKLIDFGLSIPYTPQFCKPGNRTGTPDYLPPEVIKRVTTDHRVDLFALGVTAYEAITGHLPWERRPDTLQTIMSKMNSPGKNPREYCPDLDDRTVRFLLKSIEREPKDRYQTAAEFREALRSLPYKG